MAKPGRKAPIPLDNEVRPAAVYYERGTGEALVYGSGIAAVLFLLVGLRSSAWPMLAGAGVAACIAYYFHPMILRRPALAFDAERMHVTGIGTIEWANIKDVRRADRPVRTLTNPILQIELAPGADTGLKRRPLTRPAGRLKNGRIEIQLQGLKADPDALSDALDHAWRRAG